MKTLGRIFLGLIIIIASVFVSLLETHIILSVAELYTLKFVTQFTFVQIFGILFLFSIILFKAKKRETKDTGFTDAVINWVSDILGFVVSLLVGWWLMFIMFDILT